MRRVEQRLADHVVELVRAGVGQVLALEQHPHAELLRQAVALGDRGRAAPVVAQQRRRARRGTPGRPRRRGRPVSSSQAGRHQRLGDEAPAELAEPAVGPGLAHQAHVAIVIAIPPVVGLFGHRVLVERVTGVAPRSSAPRGR